MDSTFTAVMVSALAVLGLYFLWTVLGELIFGRPIKVVAVVPVTSPEVPVEEILDALRGCAPIGSTILVDYSGQIKTPQQVNPHGFRTAVAAPEHLRETLSEIGAGR